MFRRAAQPPNRATGPAFDQATTISQDTINEAGAPSFRGFIAEGGPPN